ncbi:MAG: DUF3488 domain-containing transglutaminase family protein [Gammaproteobacteria bacterium]|nr:DUF3488 domain-containing transglutaminase family protein [Gammaproteobacteria bacterium]
MNRGHYRGVLEQIPRSSLTLLLLAQGAVIAPHLPRMAFWTLLIWGACVFWRLLIHQGRWGYPSALTKAAFVVLAGVGVGMSYGIQFSLDPAVALLIIAFALKLLEMRNRRDALVVIFLGYFIIATAFLFEQGILITVYQLLAVLVVTAALVALHQSWNRPRPLASVRTAGIILLQAIPLTIVIFVFFPRIAPLWSVPLPDAAMRTGLSESMTPGSITQLGRSRQLAFRVEFEGAPPAPPGLYWRVMTYSNYQNGTWTQGSSQDFLEQPVHWVGASAEPGWVRQLQASVVNDAEPIRYTVLAEPTYRPWLYALDLARPLTRSTGLGRDFRVVHYGPVSQRFRYEVESRPAALDVGLADWYRLRETSLPGTGNPRTRHFVAGLLEQQDTSRGLALSLLQYFAREPFHYTLNPPALGTHDIDEFLFDTRRGFCGHYASAFVYMMRLAGVPARVVAGYQGGEFNPVGGYMAVRQYDAHAWAEIWIENEGWVRFDPTMAVAPDRIELGAEAAFAQNEAEAAFGNFAGNSFWRRFDTLAEVIYFIESLEHRWNVMVVSYDATLQSRFLRDLLGEVTPLRVAIAAGSAAGLAILIVMLGALPGLLRRRRPPLLRWHDSFCEAFARAGFPRQPSETPRRYGQRLKAHFPELAADIEVLALRLDDALFGPAAGGLSEVPELLDSRRRLWRLRRALVWLRLARTFRRDAELAS